jgi:hypothetical protein
MTIISPPGDWPALIHEMVHHVEFISHFRFGEIAPDGRNSRRPVARGRGEHAVGCRTCVLGFNIRSDKPVIVWKPYEVGFK